MIANRSIAKTFQGDLRSPPPSSKILATEGDSPHPLRQRYSGDSVSRQIIFLLKVAGTVKKIGEHYVNGFRAAQECEPGVTYFNCKILLYMYHLFPAELAEQLFRLYSRLTRVAGLVTSFISNSLIKGLSKFARVFFFTRRCFSIPFNGPYTPPPHTRHLHQALSERFGHPVDLIIF